MKTNFFLIILLLPLFVFADIEPSAVSVSTPRYTPDFENFQPNFGTYEYAVSWGGFQAASVFVTFDKEGLQYRLETKVKTSKAIDLFYKLRYEALGILSAIDLRPIESEFDYRENSRYKVANLKFLPDGSIESKYFIEGKDTKQFRFNPHNQTLDPFSAAILARSLSWEPGTVRHFDTFNGKSRYLISFTSDQKTKLMINGKFRDVWVISPTVKKLTDDKFEKSEKLRQAKIYITADDKREIVKIASEVFVGTVNTKLVGFVPSKNAPTTEMAGGKISYQIN